MPKNEQPADGINWSLTTWEGSQREQLRQWAALPLEQMIQAIEEMGDLVQQFRQIRETEKISAARSLPGAPPESAAPVARQPPTSYGSNDK